LEYCSGENLNKSKVGKKTKRINEGYAVLLRPVKRDTTGIAALALKVTYIDEDICVTRNITMLCP
jgi:GTP cyclohydrolase I